jgi:hypothetical protein
VWELFVGIVGVDLFVFVVECTLESLLDPDHSNQGVVRRMKLRFASQFGLALKQRDKQLAQDV